MPDVVMRARTPRIGELVLACARKEIGFDALCAEVAALGFKTDSLYYLVRLTEEEFSRCARYTD